MFYKKDSVIHSCYTSFKKEKAVVAGSVAVFSKSLQ